MADINFFDIDKTYIGFTGNLSKLFELKEHFSFYPNGYKFNPKYQAWIS